MTTWADVPEIASHHAEMLEAHAVTAEWAKRAGLYSASSAPPEWNGYHAALFPGLIYPWRFAGRVEYQLATDDRDHHPKYVFRPGVEIMLNAVVPVNGKTSKVLIVEGSKQQLAAASYAPKGWGIYGVAGCWNWTNADFTFLEGREVVVIFDGDLRGNRQVWDGADKLGENLRLDGASSVKYALLPRVEKEGLDDFLAKRPEDKRADTLLRLVEGAEEKLPRRPAKGAGKPSTGSKFFDEGSLLAETLAQAVLDQAPLLLTREENIAVYSDGVYRIDKLGLMAVVSQLLGEAYRPGHLSTVTDKLAGELSASKRIAPDRMPDPLLNCVDRMVELKSGLPIPHSPEFLSTIQIPISYDPDATCSTYVSWLESLIPDQVDDLEEVVSQMLDPSRTPKKALFAYGPARSGKSTLLRIMAAVAGMDNVSGVPLHALDEGGFAPANVYGKMLNAAADLSAAEVKDLSVFKKMTGEDLIFANRKFGKQFFFINRALFAFAANEVPQVSETSKAYRERVKPFKFGNSFAGHEDPSIEEKIIGTELPGVLNRWIKANQRLRARSNFLATDPDVQKEFDIASDRVQQWVEEEMSVICHHPDGRAVVPGMVLPEGSATQPRALYQKFIAWTSRSGGPPLAERRFIARVKAIDGVHDVMMAVPHNVRALNVVDKGSGGCRSCRNGQHAKRGAQTFDQEVSPPYREKSGTTATSAIARLAFDLETCSKEELWSRGPDFVRIAGFRADHGEVKFVTDIAHVTELIQRSDMIIGHNIMGFDLLALGLDIHELAARGAIRDTLILASLADPPAAHMTGKVDKRYDLDHLGIELLGEGKHGDGKALAKQFGGWDKIPLDNPTFLEYIRGDVTLTDGLAEVLPWTPYAEREHKVAAIAAAISLNGFRIDTGLLDRRRTEIAAAQVRAIGELANGHAVPDTNKAGKPAKSPLATDGGREAIRASFERLGVSRYPKTPTGKPCMSADDMDKVIKKYGQLPGVIELAELVKEVVAQPRVYDTIAKHLHGGRVHPMINIRQAAGRWSVTQPGITVVGKRDDELIRQREVFLPEAGEQLMCFDLSQIDARALAALSGDQEYQKLFEPGAEDLHTQIALRTLGDAKKREAAKRFSHGYNYGMSLKRMVEEGADPELARQFYREMKINFPRLHEWQSEVRQQAEAGELLDNGFGRKMRPDPVRAWTQSVALCGQGAARDLLCEGLLRLPAEVVRMVKAVIHDEIVLSVAPDIIEDVKRAVLAALEFTWRNVEIVAKASFPGRNWAECYAKRPDR
jgi:P4 family phage/plasmid primase-like protien